MVCLPVRIDLLICERLSLSKVNEMGSSDKSEIQIPILLLITKSENGEIAGITTGRPAARYKLSL